MKDKIRYSEAFKLKVMEELMDAKWKSVKEAATAYGIVAECQQQRRNFPAKQILDAIPSFGKFDSCQPSLKSIACQTCSNSGIAKAEVALMTLGKVPEFANYAIADGLKRAFTRFGKWRRMTVDPEPGTTGNELTEFLPGFRELFEADLC